MFQDQKYFGAQFAGLESINSRILYY